MTVLSHTSAGQISETTDPNGVVTTYVYNAMNESDHANRRTFEQDNRWLLFRAAGGLTCRVAA